MDRKRAIWGSLFAAFTGISWAISGVFGQYLNQYKGIGSTWIVPNRMVAAGIILLIVVLLTRREEFTDFVKNKRDFAMAALAGVFGLMIYQAAFFGAVQASNAGTATVLQYLCPVITMTYCCMRDRKKPNGLEMTAIAMALVGIFLIATHGNIHELILTPSALAWGLGAAFGMFLATVIPEKLYQRRPSLIVLPVSFIAGGIVLNGLYRPWTLGVHVDFMVLVAMFFIVIFGCVAAYYFYGMAIARVGATKSTLFASTEPVTAALLSALWLKTSFTLIDIIGFVLIISTIFVMNAPIGKNKES